MGNKETLVPIELVMSDASVIQVQVSAQSLRRLAWYLANHISPMLALEGVSPSRTKDRKVVDVHVVVYQRPP